MSRREIVVDDLTGRESDKTEPRKVRWDGKEYTLDLSPDSAEALGALLTGKGPELLAKLVTPASPAPVKRGSKGKHSGSDGANKAIREWWATPEGRKATETPDDVTVPARGRIPDHVTAAYAQANPA